MSSSPRSINQKSNYSTSDTAKASNISGNYTTNAAADHSTKVEDLVSKHVVFLPRLPHYNLMAMHKNVDVVLDSIYFGGDTTTREAFEAGAPVITIPGDYLGERWTQAYYKRMGILDYIAHNLTHSMHLYCKTKLRNIYSINQSSICVCAGFAFSILFS